MRQLLFMFLLGLSILVVACKDKTEPDNRPGDPDNLYFDYQLTAKDGDEYLTLRIQFHDEDEEGNGLQVPGALLLDNDTIPVDSTHLQGYYYEINRPIETFTGNHVIKLTTGKQAYVETFEFQPFALATDLADTIHRTDHTLSLQGWDKNDQLRLLITDTSFLGNGINRLQPVANDGSITLREADLQALANGPVQLELIRESATPLQQAGKAGGMRVMRFHIRRELMLVD